MMTLVLLGGASAAALANANAGWAQVFNSSLILALLFSLVASIYRTDSQRAFWIGFAVFGWAYLGLVYGWVRYSDGNLITTSVLWEVAEFFNAVDQPSATVTIEYPAAGGAPVATVVKLPPALPNPSGSFLSVGHSIWALWLAMSGGLVARVLHSTCPHESVGERS